MKSYVIPLNKMLTTGLRPIPEALGNGNFLTKSTNLQPYAGALRGIREIERSFELNEDAQIFECSVGIFVLTSTKLYSYSAGTLTALLTVAPEDQAWSCADFGPYILFGNGSCYLKRDPITGLFSIDLGTSIELANTICRFRGRLVLGNFTEDSSLVKWSEIGSIKFSSLTELDSVKKTTSGGASLYDIGDVLCIHPFRNEHILVYGSEGIAALTPVPMELAQGAMRISTISDRGVASAKAVAVGKLEHFAVDVAGELLKIHAPQGVPVIEPMHFGEFLDTTAVVSVNRDPANREVIIGIPPTSPLSLGNSYILNEYGMGEVSSFIQSYLHTKAGETIVHSPIQLRQLDCQLSSDILTFDYPGFKTIEWIELFGTLSDSVFINVSYRASLEDEFSNGDWSPMNEVGATRIGLSGIEFKIHIAIPDYTNVKIDRIAATVTFDDRRFSMGARTDYGNKTVAEPNS